MKDGGKLDIVSEKKFGLVGQTLSHSYSPYIHSLIGDYKYDLYETAPGNITSFFNARNFSALNVTIPYKKTAFDVCMALSGSALRSHNVNLVVKESDGTLKGYNTDYDALRSTLTRFSVPVAGKKVLVLGTGGAACTVKAVCNDASAKEVVLVSRHGPNNYDNIEKHYDADVLFNATPVGMYPHNGESPIDLEGFYQLSTVYDFIYNPLRTPLIQQARARGIKAYSGLFALVSQAVYSSSIFLDKRYDGTLVDSIIQSVLRAKRNIALIGMPGSGKTTLGRVLAQKLNKPFVDIDEEIVKQEAMTVDEIFRQKGEQYFRAVEKEVTLRVLKESGKVIATGGGAILLQDNRMAMLENSAVVYIRREIDSLYAGDSPAIAGGGSIERIADVRIPIYESLADITIRAGESIETNVNLISEALQNEGARY